MNFSLKSFSSVRLTTSRNGNHIRLIHTVLNVLLTIHMGDFEQDWQPKPIDLFCAELNEINLRLGDHEEDCQP